MTTEAMRARLEDERKEAVTKLRQLRGSSELTVAEALVDEIADEADMAQASLRQHLEVSTRERLVERIARLNEALRRLQEGSYGRCEHCESPIGVRRLKAIPEATSCIACQQARERPRGRSLRAA